MTMRAPLLLTKLYRPGVPGRMVARPALGRRLDEGLAAGRQVTLVSAPAGFGKTTCVSAWAAEVTRPVAWLSLDAADDDPGRFFAYVVAALQRVQPGLGEGLAAALAGGGLPPVEGISALLANELVALDEPLVLVVDDFQVIENRAILQVMERLVAAMPRALYLVLITREDPSLPLARLRAHNQLTEIRAQDLRFDAEEVGRFLREVMGLALDEGDVALLEARTEGWAAGLQLAGLSIRDRAEPSRFIAHLSGSHRYILSYLTEEVLNQQPAEMQAFLLQTAVLDKLSGALCDAVTGRADGRALLERLYHANLFLIPLDDEQEWYRYHHLFADLLRSRLAQSVGAEAVVGLHRRASAWLAAQALWDEAIQHALAAGDEAGAAEIVARAARPTIFAGQVNTVKGWLDALPGEVVGAGQPRLAVYRAWIDLLQGRTVLTPETLAEVEGLLADLPETPESARLRLELLVILCRFVALAGNSERAIRMAEEALGRLPREERGARARAYSALAIAHGFEGRSAEAQAAYAESLRLALAAGYYSLAAHTTMIVAQGQVQYGRLGEAARLAQSIVAMGEAAGQKLFFPAGQGYVGLAGVHGERLAFAQAERYAVEGIELCRQGGLAGVMDGRLVLARLRQARGDLDGARAELAALGPAEGAAMLFLGARQVAIARAAGDDEMLARWGMILPAVLAGATGAPLPLLAREAVQAVLARVLLGQGEVERALALLDELEATAGPGGRDGRLLEVNLLRAVALVAQSEGEVTGAARAAFVRALALGEPEGYGLVFLEEGPVVAVLLRAVVADETAPERLRDYAERLLGALAELSPAEVSPAAVARADAAPADAAEAAGAADGDGLAEPLTGRELEILALIGEGHSNREIAAALTITLHTVKKHSSNIYGKLGVGSRTQAVARARELGLL